MLCQHCNQNEATTHIRKNINGRKEEMHLCQECAKELGVMEEFSMPSMAGLFSDSFIGNFLEAGAQAMNSLAGIDRCPTCGSSFDDIIKSGHIGCDECYEKFSSRLAPSVNKIHGKSKHIGKHITYTEEKETEEKQAPQPSKLELLKAQLKQAVQEQRYEDAAVLRDEIKAMEDSNE